MKITTKISAIAYCIISLIAVILMLWYIINFTSNAFNPKSYDPKRISYTTNGRVYEISKPSWYSRVLCSDGIVTYGLVYDIYPPSSLTRLATYEEDFGNSYVTVYENKFTDYHFNIKNEGNLAQLVFCTPGVEPKNENSALHIDGVPVIKFP